MAAASASGSQVRVAGIAPGTATVTVTASDPGGRTATQGFDVAVHGSFGDDFGSAASLNDWKERNDTDVSVGGGVLSVTNRTEGRLGIAEHASTPTLTAWGIQARMGRTTRRASPGVVSVTGHRRFTAARLVLRTLDDSGKDRSADASRTSGNFEFALFDRDTREWIRIANMSGTSPTVREEPNEFTDIALGHEGGDFVGYAGAGNSEELFRFDLGSSTVDGVVLGDALEHVTGVWLVNQGEPGLTALHDRIEVTGTGSSAPVPEVAEVAASAAAAARSASVAGPDADRAVLKAFYEAAGGRDWTNNDGWLTNAPLVDWHGVTIDGEGRVSALDLIRNNLAGEIAPELGSLSSLIRLHLSHNRFTGGIPSELGGLAELEGLGLRDAGLTGEIPTELGDLSSLTSLDLAHNNLTGEIPSELGDLVGLESLLLNGNNLTGEIPTEFGGLTSLTFLTVARNDLTGEIPTELANLTGLESLELGGNRLTGEIPTELGDLTALTFLNVGANELTGGIPTELAGLTGLRRLFVHQNRLTGGIPAELGNLTLLTLLDVSVNGLTGEIPTELGSLTRMEALDLGDNGLTGEIPTELGTLTALTYLSVRVNELTGGIPDGLGDLGDLRRLLVDDNDLAGRLPASLLNLSLDDFWWNRNAALCAPDTSAFQTWLAGIEDHRPGAFCVEGPEAVGTIPAQVLSVGESVTVDVSPYFRDSDGDPLTYSAASSDEGLATASMERAAVTVTGVAPGSATVTVTAADPAGLTATQTVAVTVETGNRPPEAVGRIPSISVPVGGSESVNVSAYFSDPDGDALTYSAVSSLPGLAAASVSGRVLTVTGVGEGRTTVTVTAVDPHGLTATQRVSVTVGPQNRAPEAVGTIPSLDLPIGGRESVDVSSYFHDPDGDELTYAASSGDAGVASASVSGSVVAVAGAGTGRTTVTVTAEDPGGLTATQEVAVAVGSGNRAPEAVGTIPPQTVEPVSATPTSLDLSPYFRDPDGDPLTYTANSPNTNVVGAVVIDNHYLSLAGTDPGTVTVTVTATDPGGLTATQTVVVTVRTNQAPEAVGTIPTQVSISSQPAEPHILDVSPYFRDPDGEELAYSASSTDEASITVGMDGSVLTATPVHSTGGEATVTVTAADQAGLTATQTFVVSISVITGEPLRTQRSAR